jgi:hypothetical protein
MLKSAILLVSICLYLINKNIFHLTFKKCKGINDKITRMKNTEIKGRKNKGKLRKKWKQFEKRNKMRRFYGTQHVLSSG